MVIANIQLAGGTSVDIARLGRPAGRPVLYFHSPATSGEELTGAADQAAQLSGIELLTIVRPSIAVDDHVAFVAQVASTVELAVAALDLGSVAVLGWSGGAPYALAASAQLGPAVSVVHLVSPLPGPLVGPDAVPRQTERLRQLARTSPSSSWATAPGALRDYQALAAPWPFAVSSVRQPVTIWSPADDSIVPPGLADRLAGQLLHAERIDVPGTHDWLMENWTTVLERIAVH